MSRACPHQWRNRCSAPPHTSPSHLRWFEDVQGYQSFALLHFFLLLPGYAGACSELFSCSSPDLLRPGIHQEVVKSQRAAVHVR